MTMPFETEGVVPPLNEGDRIAATLVVTSARGWLEGVTVTARNSAGSPRLPSASRAMAGALVPDLPLIDQNGAPVTLRGFAGRVLVVTFIYTRCPMPDLCPLVVRHLEAGGAARTTKGSAAAWRCSARRSIRRSIRQTSTAARC